MIAGAEFAVVSGSGHYPWAENPAEFNPILFGFSWKAFRVERGKRRLFRTSPEA
jgi:hypothetical protein